VDKEKRKILKTITKIFGEKGIEGENLKDIAEVEEKGKKRKLHTVDKITDLKDMLNKSGEKYKDKPAFKLKTDIPDEFRTITYDTLLEQVNSLGTELINIGLMGKRIAVIGENCYEWALAYLAISCGTGVVVPLDKSLPANELETLIIRSGAEAIFYTDKYNDMMQDIRARRTTDLRYYISMDLKERKGNVYSEYEFVRKGKELIENGDRRFLDSKINNEEMAFMLFTSGTTANSKAVMLSHKNICANLMDIGAVLNLDDKDTLLSFLPLHHTFECTVGFLYPMYCGACLAYSAGAKHLANELKEYQITAMISVPALLEVMYRRVMKGIEQKGKLDEVQKVAKLTNVLTKVGLDFRKKMFKEIHDNLGGKLRIVVSGAAALDHDVEKGFNDLGFRVIQGYGLTETSPVASTGSDFEQKMGAVGKVLPSYKVKIIDKDDEGVGEIILKGPCIMLGYYQNEEATKEVLEKDWFHTGDLGYIDKKGFLHISGRKKSVIILKNGKNIFPEEIESIINRIDGVKESFIYGKPEKDDENDLKLCAKVVYDEELMKEIYGIKECRGGLPCPPEEIQKIIWEKIKELNKTMPPYKYIKELIITTEELIKTTTLKIKRHEEMKKLS